MRATTEDSMSAYQDLIRTHLARAGRVGFDARQVEAWMRLENGTLDALSPSDFAEEVQLGADVIEQAEPELSENLAQSYGL